jgi:RNA polymerase sigma factor (sigma-70 family)
MIHEGCHFETEAELTAYVRQIARNKVKKGARHHLYAAKRDLRRQEPLDSAVEVVDPTPDPCERIVNKKLLQQALQTLSEEDRDFLRMKFHEELSHREIAEKLGWDQRAVTRKLVQILTHVGEIYQPPVCW